MLLAVAGGVGLPSVASAQPPSSERQILKCYEEGVVLFCEQDELQKLINQAGTTPTRIEIGNAIETLVTKTLVIPAGADIELVDTEVSPWSSSTKIIRDDGNFTGNLIRVEKGGKLTLSDGTGNGEGLIIDSRAQYENVVKGSSFAPTISVEGELVMNAGTIKGARKMSNGGEGAVTVKGKDAKFTLNRGKITDNQRKGGQFGAANVALTDGAKMVMNGGEISKGVSDNSPYAYGEAGGIGIFSGAHLTVNGGKITENTGWAGNINVSHWLSESNVMPGDDTSDTRSTLEFNDGEITKGKAAFAGGGINIFGNADVTMNGGLLDSNRAPNGGGVNAMDMYINGDPRTYREIDSDGSRWTKQHFGEGKPEEWTKISPAGFTMNGGSITRNSATRTGGGVNVISNAVKLNAGLIEENSADQQGGGVYVATKSYNAHFMDTFITDNQAAAFGGGIWLCPTGSMIMHVTNGVAVFDNEAPKGSGGLRWGDDVAHDNYGSVSQAGLRIDPRMLGGGEPTFYKDGSASSQGNRFNPANPGKKQIFDGNARESDDNADYRTAIQNEGLKTIVDAESKETAKSWAKLTIQKNTAPRGAGVGSNGGLTFGTPGTTKVKVTKAWKDAEGEDLDADATVPVKVQLVGKVGDDTSYIGEPVELNADNEWTHTFENLPKTKTVDGKQVEIKYSVEEQGVEGTKAVKMEGNAKDGLTLNAPTATSPVNVQLLESTKGKKQSPVGDPVVLNAENDWSHTFKGLPETKDVYGNGNMVPIIYSFKELGVAGFKITVDGDAKDGFTVTNTQVPVTTEVPVEKVWKDADGSALDPTEATPVKVLLTQTIGEKTSKVGDPVELNAKNEWKHTFKDLPQYNVSDGKRTKIEYSVEELSVDGFTSKVTGDADKGFTITNTENPPATTEVDVAKVWKDADGSGLDAESTTPVDVQLMKTVDGKSTPLGDPVELNAKNEWKHTFTNLPVIEKIDGKKLDVTYWVEEIAVSGFKSELTGDAENGFVLTNTQIPPVSEVPVEKVWKAADGSELDPSESQPVKVQLKKTVGDATDKVGEPVELNAGNGWKYTFTNLPVTEKVDGEKVDIHYSVEELSVEGFTSKVTGNAQDGFTITNTQTPPPVTEVNVTKVWKAADGSELDSSATVPVKVQLTKTLAGKTTPVADPVVLNAANGWTHTFTQLLVAEEVDGQLVDVTYSVEELAVEGFTSRVTGNAQDGFTITNTQTPPPPTPTPEPSPTPEPTPTPGPTPGKPKPRPSMPRTGVDGGSAAVWAVAGLLGVGAAFLGRRRR